MSEELFAKCYVDEGFSRIFSNSLRAEGFDVKTVNDLRTFGMKDAQQLDIAIEHKRVLITKDKRTFVKESEAKIKPHFGVIVIMEEISDANGAAVAKEVIKRYSTNTRLTSGRI